MKIRSGRNSCAASMAATPSRAVRTSCSLRASSLERVAAESTLSSTISTRRRAVGTETTSAASAADGTAAARVSPCRGRSPREEDGELAPPSGPPRSRRSTSRRAFRPASAPASGRSPDLPATAPASIPPGRRARKIRESRVGRHPDAVVGDPHDDHVGIGQERHRHGPPLVRKLGGVEEVADDLRHSRCVGDQGNGLVGQLHLQALSLPLDPRAGGFDRVARDGRGRRMSRAGVRSSPG